MADKFDGSQPGLESPATKGFAIAGSDAADLAFVTRAIYVGGAGNIKVQLADDPVASPVTFVAVPAGTILSIRAKRVWATLTTATNLIGLH